MTNLEILAAAIKLHTGTSNNFDATAEVLAQSIAGTDKQKQNPSVYTLALPQSCTRAK